MLVQQHRVVHARLLAVLRAVNMLLASISAWLRVKLDLAAIDEHVVCRSSALPRHGQTNIGLTTSTDQGSFLPSARPTGLNIGNYFPPSPEPK